MPAYMYYSSLHEQHLSPNSTMPKRRMAVGPMHTCMNDTYQGGMLMIQKKKRAHQSPFISCAYRSHTVTPSLLMAAILAAMRLAWPYQCGRWMETSSNALEYCLPDVVRLTTAGVMLANPSSGIRASASGGFPGCACVACTYLS